MKIMILGYLGYIGWPLTLRLLSKDHRIVGIDNNYRVRCVKEMNSISATNISNPNKRQDLCHKIGNCEFHNFDIVGDALRLEKIIKRHKPDIIVNLAHNPSAPYSQIDRKHANGVLINNILGMNNLLWFVNKHCPDTHMITIGTTGEYCHNSNIDIEEGTFIFRHNGRVSTKCIYPRQANSIYHASKVSSTYIIDYLTRLWNLRCTDVMQSVVFGLYTPETEKYQSPTRFDTDDAFGTVLNRFIVQAMLGQPLTIYGHGSHQRGFLSLNDSIQALEIAINNPAEKGEVQTWNQLSEWNSMNDVAQMVKDIFPDTKMVNIDSPRKEFTGGHYYKYVLKKLVALGYKPTRTLKEEIQYVSDTITITPTMKDILIKVIQPKIIF